MSSALESIVEAILWFLQFFLISETIHKTCDRRGVLSTLRARLVLGLALTVGEMLLLKQRLVPTGFKVFYFGSMALIFCILALTIRASYLMTATFTILLIMMRTSMIPISEKIVLYLCQAKDPILTSTQYYLSEFIGTIILIVAVFAINSLAKPTNYELPKRIQLLILFNVIAFALIVIFNYDTLALAVDAYDFFLVLFVLICSYIVFINYSTISYGKQTENQMQLQYLQYEKQFERELLNSYDELRKLRHDFKNHVFYMDTLLKSQHYQELDAYFQNLSEKVYENTSQVSTGNHLCNLVLEQKRLIAAQQDIPIKFNCQIPTALNIADMDLVSFLSNVLDNAIEASAFVENPEITVDICRKNADLHVKVSNRYDRSHSGITKGIRTTKADKLRHGFGLTIVKDIARKYDGTVSFVQDKDQFTVLGYLKI